MLVLIIVLFCPAKAGHYVSVVRSSSLVARKTTSPLGALRATSDERRPTDVDNTPVHRSRPFISSSQVANRVFGSPSNGGLDARSPDPVAGHCRRSPARKGCDAARFTARKTCRRIRRGVQLGRHQAVSGVLRSAHGRLDSGKAVCGRPDGDVRQDPCDVLPSFTPSKIVKASARQIQVQFPTAVGEAQGDVTHSTSNPTHRTRLPGLGVELDMGR